MADLTGRMIGARQADVKTFTEIEADQSAMGQAVTVIVIAGVAALIGNIFRAGIPAGVIGLIGSLLGYAVNTRLIRNWRRDSGARPKAIHSLSSKRCEPGSLLKEVRQCSHQRCERCCALDWVN